MPRRFIAILWSLLFLVFRAPLPGAAEPADIEVSITGVEGALLENVRASLSIEKYKDRTNLTEPLVKRLYERAFQEVGPSLQPFGYYGPRLEGELLREGSLWRARYTVFPGEPVRVSELKLGVMGAGADDETLRDLVAAYPLQKGSVLDHAVYEKEKRRWQRLALNRGYLDAELTEHRIEVTPEKHAAVITLHLETGPRYRFGEVTFQQEKFSPEFLSRFVTFRRGDPYSQASLFQLQNALRDGNYFSEIEVRPRRDLAEGLEVPVEVKLVPRKRQQYTAGVGYGTDTGVRGSLGWDSRRINRWGHRMNTELRLSEVRSNFSTRYIVPLKNPLVEHRNYTVGWFRENTDTSESDGFSLGVSDHHLRGKWKETVFVNYQREDFTVGDQEGQSNLLLPGMSWTRIKADDRVYASRGYRALLEVIGAHDAFLSDTSFLQCRLSFKYIRGVRDFGRILLRGEGGTSLVSEFSEVPASLRFFAGGDQSIRGYAYRSLGPTDDAGEVIGGEHLLVGSVEYEHKLPRKFSAALFYDVGNAFDSPSESYKQGLGFGLRWRSPVGLIRLDLASAVSESENPWRLHFTLGPDL
jgi:translocation and assembly module TamA